MVQSRSHGNFSSRPLSDDAIAAALHNLKTIASTKELLALQNALGVEIYLVGGLVRDLITTSLASIDVGSIHDLDLAISLSPHEAMEKLTTAGIHAIPTGILHGTISAVFLEQQLSPCFSKKLQIQLTTFRKPGSRTSHEYSSTIQEDLSGRDFTINALAYEVTSQRLIDPFNGLNDIRGNTVRAVSSPQDRFNEDPQRIMRMVRFGPAAGRTVETSTQLEAKKLTARLTEISIERIRDEFLKILLSDHPAQGLRLLKELGILDWLVPEIIPSYNLEQNEFHREDVFEHTLTVVEHATKDLHVRLAAFFHDLGKPSTLTTGDDGRRHFYLHEQKSAEIAREVMTRLKCSNADIQEVMLLVAYHMRPIDCGAPGARRLIRDLGSSYDRWRELKIADSPPVMAEDDFRKMLLAFDELITIERVRNFSSPYSKLAITGNDILGLGIPAGPEVGQLLKALLELVADDPEKNKPEVLIEEVKARVGKS